MKTYLGIISLETAWCLFFEKEADYPQKRTVLAWDNSKLVPAFEGRYYFDKNYCFSFQNPGRKKIQQTRIRTGL